MVPFSLFTFLSFSFDWVLFLGRILWCNFMLICEIMQSIMLVGLVIRMIAYTNCVFVCLYDDDEDDDDDGGDDNGKYITIV